jgi:transcription antitermination factor NusG
MEHRDRRWRVFYTAPRAEKRCEDRLERQGVEVLLPKAVVIRQWSDRKKKVVEPLFRNYIFARVDERERLQVLQAQGIVRCVSFGGQLADVSEGEIEALRIAQREPHRLTVVDLPLPEIGEQVVVTEGPLRDLKGEVTEHRGETHLIVRIPAIRQALRINVPASWVRKKSSKDE